MSGNSDDRHFNLGSACPDQRGDPADSRPTQENIQQEDSGERALAMADDGGQEVQEAAGNQEEHVRTPFAPELSGKDRQETEGAAPGLKSRGAKAACRGVETRRFHRFPLSARCQLWQPIIKEYAYEPVFVSSR